MKRLTFTLILLAIAMAGAQSCSTNVNDKTDVGRIYSVLQSANLEPQTIEASPDGSAVFTWDSTATSQFMYGSIRDEMIRYYDDVPVPNLYCYPGRKFITEDCWMFEYRRVKLIQDSTDVIRLTVEVI